MNQNLRGRLASFGKNLAATLIGLAVALLALEGGIRLLAGSLGVSPYMKYDPTLGWTARPGAEKVHKSSDPKFEVTYVINDHGFRGKSYKPEKAAGVKRVVLLGDSNGFGWGVQEQEAFFSILDNELENVEVVNLSLSGYGTDQSYLRFVTAGVRFEPDIVILQVTPNDFDEIQHPFYNQKPKPQFLLSDNGELVLSNVPVKPTGSRASDFYDNSIPLPFKQWLGWHSYSYNLVNEKYFAVRRQFTRQQSISEKRFSDQSVALFNRLVHELAGKLEKAGAKGIIVHSSRELSEQGLLQPSGLAILDLYPRFASSTTGDSPMAFYPDGFHYTTYGHRLIAEELISVLKQTDQSSIK